MPSTWTTLAAGRVEGVTTRVDGLRTDYWRSEVELPTYLYTFAAGAFAEVEDDGMSVVDRIYAGDREKPDQGSISSRGNAYLKKEFPRLTCVSPPLYHLHARRRPRVRSQLDQERHCGRRRRAVAE